MPDDLLAWHRALAEHDIDVVTFNYGGEAFTLVFSVTGGARTRVEAAWRVLSDDARRGRIARQSFRVSCDTCHRPRGWVPCEGAPAETITQLVGLKRCKCGGARLAVRQPFLRGLKP